MEVSLLVEICSKMEFEKTLASAKTVLREAGWFGYRDSS